MKISLKIVPLLLAVSSASFAQNANNFELKGHINNLQSGTVYLQKFENKYFITLDSSKVVNGKYHFTTKLQLPELYGLTLDKDNSPAYVFLEDKKITVESDASFFNRTTKVTGSVSNDLFVAYKKQKNVKIDEFIKENPASIVSAYVLYRDFSYLLSSSEITADIKLLSPQLLSTPYVSVLKELAIVKKKVEPGQKALDFTLDDQFGKPVKLSDQFGKYLLLDFWASWCPDCRAENPNLVKTYQKYHSKGFDILGVSLDKNRESWVKGIAADQLNWKHVSDLGFWDSAVAKLYGVRWIPSNFLIGPDGIIVAQNLQGDALDKKLEELLNASASKTAEK